jgi:hypothetical protein
VSRRLQSEDSVHSDGIRPGVLIIAIKSTSILWFGLAAASPLPPTKRGRPGTQWRDPIGCVLRGIFVDNDLEPAGMCRIWKGTYADCDSLETTPIPATTLVAVSSFLGPCHSDLRPWFETHLSGRARIPRLQVAELRYRFRCPFTRSAVSASFSRAFRR